MKKLFFTAIALVAYSGVSSANTIIDKENADNKIEVIIKARNCAEEANQLIDTIVNEEGQLSPEEEDYYWYTYYSGCLKS